MTTPGISKRAAITAALLLLGGAGAWFAQSSAPVQKTADVEFGKGTLEILTASGSKKLDVELALTPEQQAHGLMFRTSLADGQGMLFLHAPPREVRMWMHNTYIPLDMVFIREDGTIHRIEARAEPLSDRLIESGGPVAGVLEISGGAAERLGIKKGDKVLHAHFSGPSR